MYFKYRKVVKLNAGIMLDILSTGWAFNWSYTQRGRDGLYTNWVNFEGILCM